MEEIYANVEAGKPVSCGLSTNHSGPRSSGRRLYGPGLSLGLLSLLLLAVVIALSVIYHHSVRDSSAELSTLKANLTSVSEERDLLNASLADVSKELHRVQARSKQKRSCPAGWRTFSCSCYFLSTYSASWEKARQDCRQKEAALVSVDTSEKQEFLSNIIKRDTWIGLNDRESEGTWIWTDKTPLTVRYWSRGQPDNGGGSSRWGEEDCAHIISGAKTAESWNDRQCNNSMLWICEKLP